MATIAPVVVSLALWLITGSVFALVFAALGPAVAVASLVDARIQSRRTRRRERGRFAAELDAARREVDEAHARERAALERAAPSALRLVEATWPDAEQWLADLGSAVVVGVGAGERESSLTLDGLPTASRARGSAERAVHELAEAAHTIALAPVGFDARIGIGVVGPAVVADAVLRGLVLQLAALLPPGAHAFEVEAPAGRLERWSWVDALPHSTTLSESAAARHTRIRLLCGAAAVPAAAAGQSAAPRSLTLAAAERRESLPRSARIVIAATGATGRIAQHPDPGETGMVRLELVSLEQAHAVAVSLDSHATREGLTGAATLPHQLAFADLPDSGAADETAVAAAAPTGHVAAQTTAAQTTASPAGLDCVVAITADGALSLDLVAHGPHAVVGGTTGSGKSELLTAWILAMARRHPPNRASVLLVDFKGGSAFAPLASLPHCVGTITDLDEAGAGRALVSLSAELRRRERYLASVGAKSVDALDATRATVLPRLVIVVDEFAAMVAGFPELHALFADIAARGRSLGVHLVLCTQRPAGVIRDAVLANSALRLSLRVNNRADSSAVIGTDAASALPVHPRGRAYVSTDGEEPVLAQFPLVTSRDIAGVEARWHGFDYRPHRPWLDPLPTDLPLEPLLARSAPGDGTALPFGMLDDPDAQSQPDAEYRPVVDGNLLVVGGAASGKSTLLDTLARSARAAGVPVHVLPADIEGAWDTLHVILRGVRRTAASRAADARAPAADGPAGRLVFVDDLDRLLGRFPDDYEPAVLDLLTQAMREGPARGLRFVVTTQRFTAALHQVSSLCGSRMLLRLPNRQEHVLAGGDGADYAAQAPPGSGRWHGLAVQVARSQEPPAEEPPAQDRPAQAAPAQPPPAQGRPPRHVAVRDGQHRDIPALDVSRPLAVVSSRPADFVSRLRAAFPGFGSPGSVIDVAESGAARVSPPGVVVTAGGRLSAIVGDPDAWQSRWGALQAARATHTVVVDGVGAGEFRAVTRLRSLPPPLADDDAFWVWGTDGVVRRARLPGRRG